MARSIYCKIDGEWRWIEVDKCPPAESVAPAVHQDTLKQPLRHMVTGEISDSRSWHEKTNKRLGFECIGTEKLSEQRHRVADRLTDDKILDGIAKAEAIASDPAKLRARVHENAERLERFRKTLNADY